MKKLNKKSVAEQNIEIAKKLRVIIIRCLRARGIPNYFRNALRKILLQLESFLKHPDSKIFLNNIGYLIDIIIKLMRILEILGK